jgi:hypothetical protein
MPRRRDLYVLTPQERQELVAHILAFLNDAVVRAHTTITHQDVHIFTGHRAYIARLESFLDAGGWVVPDKPGP